MALADTLTFPDHARRVLDAYLPPPLSSRSAGHGLFTTLTYATSLDSNLAIAPGVQTALSGKLSKAMTHYMRTKYDAIMIGAGTAICDDPTLNSRLEGAVGNAQLQPRPVILDRRAEWRFDETSKVIRAANEGRGKAPWVLVDHSLKDSLIHSAQSQILEDCGGRYIFCESHIRESNTLLANGIRSVMIEGGSRIINHRLENEMSSIASVVITLAPLYLGKGAVNVSPARPQSSFERPAIRFSDVTWLPLGQDVVMCGRPETS